MDIAEYRKQYAKELEKAAREQTSLPDLVGRSRAHKGRPHSFGPSRGGEVPLDDIVAVLADKEEDTALRLQLIESISSQTTLHRELANQLLAILRDPLEPPELRQAALQALQQASFRAADFAPLRPDFLATLRGLVEDPDRDLRQRVLGILAREKDEYVQRRLVEGLESPRRALLPASKAIQLLGYDIHADYFPLLRRIVERPPSRAAKKEALRLLGADPASKDLLARVFVDRGEAPDVRQQAGVALQTLDPDRFEALARRIALDDGEDDRVRASSLSALAHFGNPATLGNDRELARAVDRMGEKSSSASLRRASKSFTRRQGGP